MYPHYAKSGGQPKFFLARFARKYSVSPLSNPWRRPFGLLKWNWNKTIWSTSAWNIVSFGFSLILHVRPALAARMLARLSARHARGHSERGHKVFFQRCRQDHVCLPGWPWRRKGMIWFTLSLLLLFVSSDLIKLSAMCWQGLGTTIRPREADRSCRNIVHFLNNVTAFPSV